MNEKNYFQIALLAIYAIACFLWIKEEKKRTNIACKFWEEKRARKWWKFWK